MWSRSFEVFLLVFAYLFCTAASQGGLPFDNGITWTTAASADLCAGIKNPCGGMEECTGVGIGPCKGDQTVPSWYVRSYTKTFAFIDETAYVKGQSEAQLASKVKEIERNPHSNNGYRDMAKKVWTDGTSFAYMMTGAIFGTLQEAGGYVGVAYYLNTGTKPIKTNENEFYVATTDGQPRVTRGDSTIGAPEGPFRGCIAPKTGDGSQCGAQREYPPGAVKFSFFGYATGPYYNAKVLKGVDGLPAGTTHLGIRQIWSAHGIDFADVLINGIPIAEHNPTTDVTKITLIKKNGDGIEYTFPSTYNTGPRAVSTTSPPISLPSATKNIKIKAGHEPPYMFVDFLLEADDFMGPNFTDKYFLYDPDVTYRSSADTSTNSGTTASGSTSHAGEVKISKVADKGSSGICEGEDFVELWNAASYPVDLTNMSLSDDKGPGDEDAFRFPEGSVIPAEGFMLGCKEASGGNFTFNFGLGNSDTLSLYNADLGLLDTKSLEGSTSTEGWLWQRVVGGNWTYAPNPILGQLLEENEASVRPSGPYGSHVFECERCHIMGMAYSVRLGGCTDGRAFTDGPFDVIWNGEVPKDSTWTSEYGAQYKSWNSCKMASLVAQDQAGEDFFNVNRYGGPPKLSGLGWWTKWPEEMETELESVVDMRITMSNSDLEFIRANNSYETYVPVESLTVTSKKPSSSATESVTLGKMRMRPRGQSTLAIPSCMDLPNIPFKLDFNRYNGSQTLFGMESAYLRNGALDSSVGLREWSVHRMLQRFGLPYMRNRFVMLYINGQLIGLYTIMEAPDQEYVFARSFPEYDPADHYLYKFKTHALSKCNYEPDVLHQAQQALLKGPEEKYAFDRGEHRKLIDKYPLDAERCGGEFWAMITREWVDAARAYLSHNKDCASFLLGENRVDRDLGGKRGDDFMRDFLKKFWLPESEKATTKTDEGLEGYLDVENMLKNLAVYAVTVNMDSPLGNGNNFFMASPREGRFWGILQYDHNGVGANGGLCSAGCEARSADWSIAEPTCRSFHNNSIFGPLLKNVAYYKRYLDHVAEFNKIFADPALISEMLYLSKAMKESLMKEKIAHMQFFKRAVDIDPMGRYSYFEIFDQIDTNKDGKVSKVEADLHGWSYQEEATPFIPWIIARGNSVENQLQRLEENPDYKPNTHGTCLKLDTTFTTPHTCSQKYCTSPGKEGKTDCWAGTTDEPMTCSGGRIPMKTGPVLFSVYFEYTCCEVNEILLPNLDPEMKYCELKKDWESLSREKVQDVNSFHSGGLGKLMKIDVVEVWLCYRDHVCSTPSNYMCWTYHEKQKKWMPWATNEKLGLYRAKTPDSCPQDCSGHGACVLGICTCDFEWAGDDCSVLGLNGTNTTNGTNCSTGTNTTNGTNCTTGTNTTNTSFVETEAQFASRRASYVSFDSMEQISKVFGGNGVATGISFPFDDSADMNVYLEEDYCEYCNCSDSKMIPRMPRIEYVMEAMNDESGAEDVSNTNNQVLGVDEADTVKNDNMYIYMLPKRVSDPKRFVITRAYPPEQAEVLSTTDLSVYGLNPRALLLDGDVLVVIGRNGGQFSLTSGKAWGSVVTIQLWDVSDRFAPRLDKTVQLEGEFLSARMVSGRVYVILKTFPQWVNADGSELNLTPDSMPKAKYLRNVSPLYRELGSKVAGVPAERKEVPFRTVEGDVTNIGRLEGLGDVQAFITVLALDVSTRRPDTYGLWKTATHAGRGQTVFVSTERIYVAATTYDYIRVARPAGNQDAEDKPCGIVECEAEAAKPERGVWTAIMRFEMNDGAPAFGGITEVDGSIINQFAMDEYEGYLRVATTKGMMWSTPTTSETSLTVFDKQLAVAGVLDGSQKSIQNSLSCDAVQNFVSQRIYSVRFMGARGYVVTYRQVDPFFVFDVSTPTAPKLLGYLKIPGFSDYLHPLDSTATRMLGIGKDTQEETDASGNVRVVTKGVKLSLFNVNDPTNPQEEDTLVLGDKGSSTEVSYEHKAFLYHAKSGIISLPVSLYQAKECKYRTDGGACLDCHDCWTENTYQGAYIIDLTGEMDEKTFRVRGRVTHERLAGTRNDAADTTKLMWGLWGGWRSSMRRIYRTIYMDGSLYTISDRHMQAHDLTSMQEQTTVNLTVPTCFPASIYEIGTQYVEEESEQNVSFVVKPP